MTELVAASTGELMATHDISAAQRDDSRIRQRLVAGRQRGSTTAPSRRPNGSRGYTGRIASQRRDLAHQISRRLVNECGTIVHEELQITNMVRRPAPRPNEEGGFDPNGAAAKGGLNREILAAGWGQLLRYIDVQSGRSWSRRDRSQPSAHLPDLPRMRARRPGEPLRHTIPMYQLRPRRPRRHQRSTEHLEGRAGPTPRARSRQLNRVTARTVTRRALRSVSWLMSDVPILDWTGSRSPTRCSTSSATPRWCGCGG